MARGEGQEASLDIFITPTLPPKPKGFNPLLELHSHVHPNMHLHKETGLCSRTLSPPLLKAHWAGVPLFLKTSQTPCALRQSQNGEASGLKTSQATFMNGIVAGLCEALLLYF